MGNENEKPEYPDTTHHISDSLVEYLHDLGDKVNGDEEAVARTAAEVAKRRVGTEGADLTHEAAGIDTERRDLMNYAEETGDPGVDEAIEKLKREDLEVDVDRRNLPPPQE